VGACRRGEDKCKTLVVKPEEKARQTCGTNVAVSYFAPESRS
jgi:hypothetical protein